MRSNPAQKKAQNRERGETFPQILNLGEGLRRKNSGVEKIQDQIKKLKFIHPMRTTWLINSPPLLFYYFDVTKDSCYMNLVSQHSHWLAYSFFNPFL